MGGGSLGKSKNKSSNQWAQNIYGPQGQALQQLWNMGIGQAQQGPQYQPQLTQAAQQIQQNLGNLMGNYGQAFQQQAAGGAFTSPQEYQQRMFNMMGQPSQTGRMYESIVGGRGNTYVDPLIQSMQQDAARNFQTMTGQNALEAVAAGQSGGSRQAMQNAMMGAQLQRDLAGQEAQARAGAYDKDLAMKMDIARQADLGRQQEQDRLYNMMQGAQQAQQTAMGSVPGMMPMATAGMQPWAAAQQAQWSPLMNLANIIGPAIMQGQGSGASRGKGMGMSGYFGMGR